MHLLESYLCGKENNPDTCEDGLVIAGPIAAVIDGVTAKGHILWNGEKSGLFAKNTLCQYFTEMLSNPSQGDDLSCMPADALFRKLNSILHAAAIKINSGHLSPEDYPRAAIILYNEHFHEIWSYGDCQCRINDNIYTHSKAIDELNANQRAYTLEYAIAHGTDPAELLNQDPGREAIKQNLLMQFSFENMTCAFGYPILNGQNFEPSLIRTYPVKAGDTITLASDGYPVLGQDLDHSEQALSEILREDPLCFRRYRSTKGVNPGNVSFDDRCWCRFIAE